MFFAGLKAYVSSVDLEKLPSRFARHKWLRMLIAVFPSDCDPCGEHGEIHTIVMAGPMSQKTVLVSVGEVVEQNGFVLVDIIPIN
jgi:diphthamide synthase (EF-2-diphthine--ammonia ligase)